MTARKIFAAVLGLVAGVITSPIAALAWPVFCARFLVREAGKRAAK